MQEVIKISVIIPNYNRAHQLLGAVESVLKQTYAPLEILICDDGSNDNSEELIQKLGNPNVKWITCGRNGMPSVPRNIGIKQSAGNWIAFLDNDDYWHETKLEEQVNAIKKTGLDAICTNAWIIQQGKKVKTYHSDLPFSEIDFNLLIQSNYIMCSSVLVAKKAVEEAGGFSERRELKALEDYDLWLKIACRHKFYYVNKELVFYNDDAVTSIRNDSLTTPQQLKLIFEEFKNWAGRNSVGNEKLKAIEKKFVLTFLNPWQSFVYKLRKR